MNLIENLIEMIEDIMGLIDDGPTENLRKHLAQIVVARRSLGAPRPERPEIFAIDSAMADRMDCFDAREIREIVDLAGVNDYDRKFLLVTWPAWQKRSYELSLLVA